MIDLSAAAATATGGFILLRLVRMLVWPSYAYDAGFEDGKRYMAEVLRDPELKG